MTASASPQRLAAGYFLGACLLGVLVFACMRGAGRVVLPVLLAVLVGVLLVRVVRAVMRPLP